MVGSRAEVSRWSMMSAESDEPTGNTQTEGREHRERRRLAALALAATNEEANEGQ